MAQTHLPSEWVIVDDGSTDATREIVSEYVAEYPWIRLIESGLQGRRERGSRIVEAFNRGRLELRRSADVTVKLDGDLYLPAPLFRLGCRGLRADTCGGRGGRCRPTFGKVRRGPQRRRRATTSWATARRIGPLVLKTSVACNPQWAGTGSTSTAPGRAGGASTFCAELSVLHFKQRGSAENWWQARWEEGVGTRSWDTGPIS